jgi:hypothetical protein
MKPHGHPNFGENQDKLDARNQRAFVTNNKAKWGGDPCAYCGCGCKHSAPTVGILYSREEQPWWTTEDQAALEAGGREADIYLPIGPDCLRKLKKLVPNLWTEPHPLKGTRN